MISADPTVPVVIPMTSDGSRPEPPAASQAVPLRVLVADDEETMHETGHEPGARALLGHWAREVKAEATGEPCQCTVPDLRGPAARVADACRAEFARLYEARLVLNPA